jgi:PAS domain S-box-containing protein/putative nucleotidyltransferase with HDIG domain
VDTRDAFVRELDSLKPDIVLADYRLPTFNGLEAVQLQRRIHPEIPVVMVSGSLGDESVAELLKAGARDYVLKDNLGRLPHAVTYALSVEAGIRARKAAERTIRERAQELSCLRDVQAIRAEPGNSLEDIFAKVVRRLPGAYRYPELVCARISFEGRTYESEGFEETARRDARPLAIGGESLGAVEVFYKPADTALEPPGFLPEEHSFLEELVLGLALSIERSRAEQRLVQSEQRLRVATTAMRDAFILIEGDAGTIVAWNPAAEAMFGYGADEAIGKAVHDIIVPGRDREAARRGLEHFNATGEGPLVGRTLELEALRRDGSEFSIELSLSAMGLGGTWCGVGIARDITERKQAAEDVRASRDLLRSVVENIPIRVFWKDAESRFLGCNSVFARDAGMSAPEDLLGKDDYQMGWREQAELYRADDKQVMDSDAPKLGIEEPQTAPDGRTIWLRTSKVPLHRPDGRILGVLGVYEDITESKQAEQTLRKLNLTLRTLSAGNEALVHAESEEGLLREMCRILVEIGNYRSVWIGYAERDPGPSIRVVAKLPVEGNIPDSAVLTWAGDEAGQHPAAWAIRRGEVQLIENVATAPGLDLWREEMRAAGIASAVSLPLISGGETLGVLHIQSDQVNAFSPDELGLLGELAADTAFGLRALRTRVERNHLYEDALHVAEKTKQALDDTVGAIARTVEKRDPYTSGHQGRVAELAAAIAMEMGLGADRVEGVRLGGVIHDIGKIYIPAEILSRPGRLGDVEFELIKTHPQVGYEIVRDIEFPWPVAEMILQHHERLDGSGYPHGLKNGEIVLEAQILAVADVVEAMTAHRPYRPGLGIDAALEEIRRGRGKLYATEAADACLRLFEEKGFQWPSLAKAE